MLKTQIFLQLSSGQTPLSSGVQQSESGQHLAYRRARKVADISATLLRPYLTLLLGRHHGLPHPILGWDTKHVHISAISCGPQSGKPLVFCAGPLVVMKRPNIPALIKSRGTVSPHRGITVSLYNIFVFYCSFNSDLVFEQRTPSGWTALLSQYL